MAKLSLLESLKESQESQSDKLMSLEQDMMSEPQISDMISSKLKVCEFLDKDNFEAQKGYLEL